MDRQNEERLVRVLWSDGRREVMKASAARKLRALGLRIQMRELNQVAPQQMERRIG